jgi:hypothetical protein
MRTTIGGAANLRSSLNVTAEPLAGLRSPASCPERVTTTGSSVLLVSKSAASYTIRCIGNGGETGQGLERPTAWPVFDVGYQVFPLLPGGFRGLDEYERPAWDRRRKDGFDTRMS